jgi:hypothetical protein
MNTKDKDLTTKSLTKTLCTTLACLVASGALALDDRNGEPTPDNEPDPDTTQKPDVVKLPDMVPMGITHTFNHVDTTTKARIYDANVTVANFGTADSGDFMVLIGYKVTGTYDAVKYPLGSTHYSGWVQFNNLKPLDIVDVSHKWAFHIPVAVHGAEIFIVVDRFWNLFDPADIGTWEDDFGKDLMGNVAELKESNNVLGGDFSYYYEYQEPDTTVSVPKGMTLKPKGRE